MLFCDFPPLMNVVFHCAVDGKVKRSISHCQILLKYGQLAQVICISINTFRVLTLCIKGSIGLKHQTNILLDVFVPVNF